MSEFRFWHQAVVDCWLALVGSPGQSGHSHRAIELPLMTRLTAFYFFGAGPIFHALARTAGKFATEMKLLAQLPRLGVSGTAGQLPRCDSSFMTR